MNLLRNIFFHIQRILKTPSLFMMMVVLPFGMTSLMLFLQNTSASGNGASASMVGVVLEEGNQELKAGLSELYGDSLFYPTSEEAFQDLERGYIRSVYVIPQNFTQELIDQKNPKVVIYGRKSEQHEVLLEQDIRSVMHQIILNWQLEAQGLIASGEIFTQAENQLVEVTKYNAASSQFSLFMLMLLLYIIFNATSISSDLISFRKNHVLKRAVLTANRNRWITSSFLGAYFIFLFMANLLLVALAVGVLHLEIPNIGQVVVLIAVTIVFSLSLSLMLFRFLKEAQLSQVVSMMLTMVFAALAMLPSFGMDYSFVHMLATISPLYWLQEAVDHQTLFPAVWMVLGMAAICFTAGNYQLDHYVE